MTNDLITEYNLFIETLRCFPKRWLNSYFDNLKQLLQDLELTNDSSQLTISVTKDNNLHVNIGQRWVTKPFDDSSIGLILPLEEDPAALYCERIGYFTKGGMNEVQWVNYRFNGEMPHDLYTAWLQASGQEVQRVKTKSGFRKYHSTLFYDVVMKPEAREELMNAAFQNKKEEVE